MCEYWSAAWFSQMNQFIGEAHQLMLMPNQGLTLRCRSAALLALLLWCDSCSVAKSKQVGVKRWCELRTGIKSKSLKS